MPTGVIIWGAKLASIWSGGFAAMLYDFQVFNGASAFGVVGGFLIILLTAILTIRTGAIRFWKEETEAANGRAARETDGRERAEAEAREQRDLKHQYKSELAAERLKTDLTPILKELVAQKKAEDAVVAAIEALTESVKANTATLDGLVALVIRKDAL